MGFIHLKWCSPGFLYQPSGYSLGRGYSLPGPFWNGRVTFFSKVMWGSPMLLPSTSALSVPFTATWRKHKNLAYIFFSPHKRFMLIVFFLVICRGSIRPWKSRVSRVMRGVNIFVRPSTSQVFLDMLLHGAQPHPHELFGQLLVLLSVAWDSDFFFREHFLGRCVEKKVFDVTESMLPKLPVSTWENCSFSIQGLDYAAAI